MDDIIVIIVFAGERYVFPHSLGIMWKDLSGERPRVRVSNNHRAEEAVLEEIDAESKYNLWKKYGPGSPKAVKAQCFQVVLQVVKSLCFYTPF